jgi:hypothetical protein
MRRPLPRYYLIIDDLAMELSTEHPIHVPIPDDVLKSLDSSDLEMRKFTKKVLISLMKLPYYKWYHDIGDVIIGGFTIRQHNIYPSFST